jgi:hypothetical protein
VAPLWPPYSHTLDTVMDRLMCDSYRYGVRLATSVMVRLMCDSDNDPPRSERHRPCLLKHEQRRRIAAAVRGLAVAGALGDFTIDSVFVCPSVAPLWPLFGYSLAHHL